METIDDYDINNPLGQGSFGRVFTAFSRNRCNNVAIKMIEKSKIDDDILQKVLNEQRIHQKLKHSHIVQYLNFIEDNEKYYLVMELCQDFTLCHFLKEREGRPLVEKTALRILHQLISAVKYLHSNNIIHRDLKLTNILIALSHSSNSSSLAALSQSNDPRFDIKICDFGLAVELSHPDDEAYTICGTKAYLPPELKNQGDEPCSFGLDIYPIGVIYEALLTADLPKESNNNHHRPYKVQENPDLSSLSKDFILQTLRPSSERPSITDLEMHPLLKKMKTNREFSSLTTKASTVSSSSPNRPHPHHSLPLAPLYSVPSQHHQQQQQYNNSYHYRELEYSNNSHHNKNSFHSQVPPPPPANNNNNNHHHHYVNNYNHHHPVFVTPRKTDSNGINKEISQRSHQHSFNEKFSNNSSSHQHLSSYHSIQLPTTSSTPYARQYPHHQHPIIAPPQPPAVKSETYNIHNHNHNNNNTTSQTLVWHGLIETIQCMQSFLSYSNSTDNNHENHDSSTNSGGGTSKEQCLILTKEGNLFYFTNRKKYFIRIDSSSSSSSSSASFGEIKWGKYSNNDLIAMKNSFDPTRSNSLFLLFNENNYPDYLDFCDDLQRQQQQQQSFKWQNNLFNLNSFSNSILLSELMTAIRLAEGGNNNQNHHNIKKNGVDIKTVSNLLEKIHRINRLLSAISESIPINKIYLSLHHIPRSVTISHDGNETGVVLCETMANKLGTFHIQWPNGTRIIFRSNERYVKIKYQNCCWEGKIDDRDKEVPDHFHPYLKDMIQISKECRKQVPHSRMQRRNRLSPPLIINLS